MPSPMISKTTQDRLHSVMAAVQAKKQAEAALARQWELEPADGGADDEQWRHWSKELTEKMRGNRDAEQDIFIALANLRRHLESVDENGLTIPASGV